MLLNYYFIVIFQVGGNVNKHFFSLCLLLALMPACNRSKTVSMGNAPTLMPAPSAGVSVYTESAAPLMRDEEIGAFVLEDEENPFNSTIPQECSRTGEDVALVRAHEQNAPDRYKDSVQYGFKKIYFDFDQFAIREDQESALAYNLAIAKDLVAKGYGLVIEGHACNSAGSSEYNLMLSEKRAQSIKHYFAKHGITTEAIRTVGCGCEFPEVPRDGDREAQAPNRRDVIYAYAPEEKTQEA